MRFSTILSNVSTWLLVAAIPTQLVPRQDIPANYLYKVEEFPNGCGNGGSKVVYGTQDTLAARTVIGTFDNTPADQVSAKFTFPEDGIVYKWKLFAGSNCETQIAIGEGATCATVPTTQRLSAFIVYT